MTLVIHGAPRTKKNHARIVRVKGKPRIVQAESHDAWAEAAVLQLRTALQRVRREHEPWYGAHWPDMWKGVNLRALIYRDRDAGDLGNYLAAICDVLERAGVVENDRLIARFDGSRLFIDRKAPRVELELTPL